MKNYKNLISRIAHATKILVLGSLVAMTCSCEDFLTIYPTNDIIDVDFWKSKGDVESVMAESYRLMTSSDFLNRLIVWGELRSDNVIEGNYGGNNDIKHIMEANLLPTNSYTSWDVFYKIINNCNIVLKYAPDVRNEDPEFSQSDLDMVKGEVYAIRALCHFYLVRTFRDVPLMTEAVVNNSQNLVHVQADPLVVLDSCLFDLSRAEEKVLTTGNFFDNAAKNKGRFTKDAVRAITADVLLWKAAFLQNAGKVAEAKACYTECIEYCETVLDTRMQYIKTYEQENKGYVEGLGFELHEEYPIFYPIEAKGGYELPNATNSGKNRTARPIYNHIFYQGNSLCESIFEIQHWGSDQNYNAEVPRFYGYYDDTKFVTALLSAPRYMAEAGITGAIYKHSDFRRINYILSQKKDNEEIDRYSIIKYGYSAWSEDRSKTEGTTTFGKISYTYIPYKDGHLDKDVNWILYRIPDVMLMKAEALALRNEGSDLNEAFNLVKAVYNRSQTGYHNGVKWVGYSEPKDDLKIDNYKNAEAVLTLVLEERQRELAFEGKRWYDLVRKALRDGSTNSMLDILIPHKYESNGAAYRAKMSKIDALFFPIAEREINIANGMLKQNPVYDKVGE